MMSQQVVNTQYLQQAQQAQAAQRLQMLQSGVLTLNGKTMRFTFKKNGARPANGYMLFFGFHGGGGTTQQTNDGQYQNHKNLYDRFLPQGSIWFTPRSAEDVYNMWFLQYMEDFLFQWIQAFMVNNQIDINKVYLTGYSAGGDGVYHMGPRMADHIAGAAMMAGHPNEINLMNVRNIGYSIQVGQNDNAYNRKNQGIKYIRHLNQLGQNYGGFQHRSKIHPGMPHWMATKDGQVFAWLGSLTRNPYPDTITFKQPPNRRKSTFYYLRFSQPTTGDRQQQLLCFKDGNTFRIFGNRTITVLVNRNFVDMQQPITIIHNGQVTMERPMQVKNDVIQRTSLERMDPYYIFQDEFISNPPTNVDMKNVFMTEFALSPAEKQAQFQARLPTQLSQTPPNFSTSLQPLVQRRTPLPQRSAGLARRVQANQPLTIGNQQINRVSNMNTPMQQIPPMQDPNLFGQPRQNYGMQNIISQHTNSMNPGLNTYGQPSSSYQYGNPYMQYQSNGQNVRCLDQCVIF